MLKTKLFLAGLFIVMSSTVNAASENFNFNLSTNVGYSVDGQITGDFNSSTFTAPTNYSGSLTRLPSSTADAGIKSGAITNLLVKHTETSWQFLFSVVSATHTTYYLWNLVSSGELLASANQALIGGSSYNLVAAENEVRVTYSNNTTRTTDTIYGSPTSFIVAAVPEIDGSKLPQALLLLIAVFVLARRATSIGLTSLAFKSSHA